MRERRLSAGGQSLPPANPVFTYTYPAAKDNGQIGTMANASSGVTATYQYDALKQLTAVTATPQTPSWARHSPTTDLVI